MSEDQVWRERVLELLEDGPLKKWNLALKLRADSARDQRRLKRVLGQLHDEGAIKLSSDSDVEPGDEPTDDLSELPSDDEIVERGGDRWMLPSWLRCSACNARGWGRASKKVCAICGGKGWFRP